MNSLGRDRFDMNSLGRDRSDVEVWAGTCAQGYEIE